MKTTLTLITLLLLSSCVSVEGEQVRSEYWIENIEKVAYGVYRLENKEVVCYKLDVGNRGGISCFPKNPPQ